MKSQLMKQSEYTYYLSFPIFQRIYKEKAKIKKIVLSTVIVTKISN